MSKKLKDIRLIQTVPKGIIDRTVYSVLVSKNSTATVEFQLYQVGELFAVDCSIDWDTDHYASLEDAIAAWHSMHSEVLNSYKEYVCLEYMQTLHTKPSK